MILLSDEWMDRFVLESNKIDPQPGYENIPGSPRYDDHLTALRYVVARGKENQLVSPLAVHAKLTCNFKEFANWSGAYRMHNVRVGRRRCPDWQDIPRLMSNWEKAVEDHLFTNPIKTEENVWQLHIDFEHIHPFIDGNGRTGRLLMVNHALILGLDPWIVEYSQVQEYYSKFA